MSATAHPEIRWAQRSSESEEEKNVLLVSIIVPDLAEGYKLDVEPTKLTFSGSSRSQKQEYACDLALFSEVKPESVKKASIGKGLFLTIQKKELKLDYWPRLTQDKKVMFVKTDFDKWRDEDEQEGEASMPGDDMDMSALQGMGGGAGGMPGMPPGMMGMPGMGGGAGGPGGMDMEALMAQMNAMGAGGAGGAPPGGDSDDDNDDMPPLEETESADAKGKGKAKDDDDMPPLA